MSFFPPYSHSNIEFRLDLSNHITKYDLKNSADVDKSQFSIKNYLANLKSEFVKLDIDKLAKLDAHKLKLVPTDLSKLSDVVKNVVEKKDNNAKIKNIEHVIAGIT